MYGACHGTEAWEAQTMTKLKAGAAKLLLLGAMVALATPAAAASVTANANAGHYPNTNFSATVYTDQHGIASRLPTVGDAGALARTDNGVLTYAPGSSQPRWEISASETASSARAYGDLSTGKVGAYAGTSADGFAAASAQLFDTLTFNISGADADTITPLRFLVSLHAATPESTNYFRFQAGSGNFFTSGPFSQRNGRANTGWSQSRIWVENSTMFADLVYNVQGANPTFGVEMTLEVIAGLGGVSDFYQTAGLQIQAPRGVTFTSESGAFLTAGGVPEPATWAMMIIGFGMIGAVSRNRRTAALVA